MRKVIENAHKIKIYVAWIFDKNLVAIHKSKLDLMLHKSAYIGMCISELSKVLMYEFHYDYIEYKYDCRLKLLLKDTDSLMH